MSGCNGSILLKTRFWDRTRVGLARTPVALFLFVYDVIAFTSFPALWPHGFWHGLLNTTDFADHKIWGLMLMEVIAWGPGRLSLDALAGFASRRRRRTAPGT